MSVGSALQLRDAVYVYNDRGVRIGMYYGDLHGFTSSTVSIRRGDRIYTYTERGMPVSTEPVD
jgi:hypothetical protein